MLKNHIQQRGHSPTTVPNCLLGTTITPNNRLGSIALTCDVYKWLAIVLHSTMWDFPTKRTKVGMCQSGNFIGSDFSPLEGSCFISGNRKVLQIADFVSLNWLLGVTMISKQLAICMRNIMEEKIILYSCNKIHILSIPFSFSSTNCASNQE